MSGEESIEEEEVCIRCLPIYLPCGRVGLYSKYKELLRSQCLSEIQPTTDNIPFPHALLSDRSSAILSDRSRSLMRILLASIQTRYSTSSSSDL